MLAFIAIAFPGCLLTHTYAAHAPTSSAPQTAPPHQQGYARLPRYDDGAIQEALYSRGPLAISFDASRPTFTFYSSGVYYDTEVCG